MCFAINLLIGFPSIYITALSSKVRTKWFEDEIEFEKLFKHHFES